MGGSLDVQLMGNADYYKKNNLEWNAAAKLKFNAGGNGFHSNTSIMLGKGTGLQEKLGYEISLYDNPCKQSGWGLDLYGKADVTFYLDKKTTGDSNESFQKHLEKFGTTQEVHTYNYTAGGGAELIYRTPSSKHGVYAELGVGVEGGYRKDNFLSGTAVPANPYTSGKGYVKPFGEVSIGFEGTNTFVSAYASSQEAAITLTYRLGE